MLRRYVLRTNDYRLVTISFWPRKTGPLEYLPAERSRKPDSLSVYRPEAKECLPIWSVYRRVGGIWRVCRANGALLTTPVVRRQSIDKCSPACRRGEHDPCPPAEMASSMPHKIALRSRSPKREPLNHPGSPTWYFVRFGGVCNVSVTGEVPSGVRRRPTRGSTTS